jgi:hypothetical protein
VADDDLAAASRCYGQAVSMRRTAAVAVVLATALAGLLLLAVAGADEEDPIAAEPVTVSTDRPLYRPGEPIQVTIDNGTTAPISAPIPGGCSVVRVSQLVGGQWVPVGTCGNPNVIPASIPAGSSLTGALGPPPPPPPAGVVVIGPVAPSISRDLSKLPTVAPWQPGDPVRVIPEGASPAPFGSVGLALGPGTYRLELTFAAGLPTTASITAYSPTFAISD